MNYSAEVNVPLKLNLNLKFAGGCVETSKVVKLKAFE